MVSPLTVHVRSVHMESTNMMQMLNIVTSVVSPLTVHVRSVHMENTNMEAETNVDSVVQPLTVHVRSVHQENTSIRNLRACLDWNNKR